VPRLIGITFLGSSQLSIRSAQCCISFVREPISASIPWSSVAPRCSQRACLPSPVDFRTCRDRLPHRVSVRCVGAEVPFNVWSVDAAHLPGEFDCRPLFRPLTPEVAGLSQSFARPFGSEMGARENGLRPLFFPSG
jgi:hypothetical protein